jgi:hypothetical protein
MTKGETMKRIIISNAFSVNMLDRQLGEQAVHATPINAHQARAMLRLFSKDNIPISSCVGHADIAAIMSGILNFDVPFNRETIQAVPGDLIILGQYAGPRLPEGTTQLPEDAKISWWSLRIREEPE